MKNKLYLVNVGISHFTESIRLAVPVRQKQPSSRG